MIGIGFSDECGAVFVAEFVFGTMAVDFYAEVFVGGAAGVHLGDDQFVAVAEADQVSDLVVGDGTCGQVQ